jgi:antitoxin HicB
MRFPVELKREGKWFVVTFRDIPEAHTHGRTLDEAMNAAGDALETAIDIYFDERRIVPSPSRIRSGQQFVELPASLSAKIVLLNEMIRQNVRPIELARRLKTTPQEITRLTNLHHTSKIDRIAEAMSALGKTLEIRAA